MNYLTDKILRGTHRLYVNHYGSYLKPIDSIMDPEKASNIIYQQQSYYKKVEYGRMK